MEFPGRGSDLESTVPGQGWNLHPGAAEMPLVLLHHSRNSCMFGFFAFVFHKLEKGSSGTVKHLPLVFSASWELRKKVTGPQNITESKVNIWDHSE